MKKQIKRAVAFFATMLLLCGCQQSPGKSSIVSKNDGSFDISVVQSATRPVGSAEGNSNPEITSGAEEIPTEKYTYKDKFPSTDGTVALTVNIEKDIPIEPIPIIEVAPHYLTGADAKRVAEVLFEGENFYEAQPAFSTVYSEVGNTGKTHALVTIYFRQSNGKPIRNAPDQCGKCCSRFH